MDLDREQICADIGLIANVDERSAALQLHPELFSKETVLQLAEAVRIAVRSNLNLASSLSETAIAIAEFLDDHEALGLALRSKANALWFLGDCSSAVTMFDRAAELLQGSGNLAEVGRTLSSSIQSRALLGDYDDALRTAARAREIFSSLGDTFRIARLEINVANVLHRQNRYSEALEAYQRAYDKLLPHKDVEGIGVALHNIAVCLIALDDYDSAQQAYARARELARQNDMPLLAAQADYNVAYLYALRGEYSRALSLLRSVKEICRANGDDYHVALCDLDASGAYLELNLLQEAVDSAADSLESFQRLGMHYEVVRSELNLAIALNLQGKSLEALSLLARAREEAGREENELLAALINLHSGMTLLDLKRYNEASDLCLQAVSIFQNAGVPSKVIACLLLLGRVCLATNDVAGAANYCNKALELVHELGAPMLAYQTEFLNGRILEVAGDTETAALQYDAARLHLEAVRNGLLGDEVKIGFLRNRVGVYTRLADLALKRDGPEGNRQAFAYVEAAKSRALQDLVLAAESNRFSTDNNPQIAQIADLRVQLNWYYSLIEREQHAADRISQERLQHLREQAREREHELRRILLESPTAANSGLEQAHPADLADIQHALGAGATLVEYFTIDQQIYAAVLRQNAFTLQAVTQANQVAQALRLLQFQISKARLDSAYFARFENALIRSTQQHLQTLYEALVRPLEQWLTTDELIIVPYGPLHSLPFPALFDGSQYLVDRFTISYAPSASSVAHSYAASAQPNEIVRSLVVGVEDPLMPSVKDEVESLAELLPNAHVLWGEQATESNLRLYGAASTYIHIASHGFFRPDNPMFSSIRLSDTYLTLQDLYGMKLPAEFLALSGCVTGLNVVEEGEELVGLTRGLLYSGARTLLLSLWEIDDRSTTEFMQFLYRRFPSRTSSAHAVRNAMIELRASKPHPYYWAAFKLTVSAPARHAPIKLAASQ